MVSESCRRLGTTEIGNMFVVMVLHAHWGIHMGRQKNISEEQLSTIQQRQKQIEQNRTEQSEAGDEL